jgi:hypothetical protein
MQTVKPKLSLGSDPEMVVRNKQTGLPVSAVSIFKGRDFDYNKHSPLVKGDGRQYFHDNVNIEGTMPPASSKEEFILNVKNYVQDAREILGEDFILCNESYTIFPEKEFDSKEARTFGCSAAYDAFTISSIERTDAGKIDFRTCGGHIHVGRSDFKSIEEGELISFESKIQSVKLFELILGTALTVIDNDPSSPQRKALYGKAGEHRPTEYGVEVRSPGNYWLGSPETVGLVWDLSQIVYDIIFDGKADEILSKVDENEYVEAINSFNKEKCFEILKNLNVVPDEIIGKISELSNIRFFIHENWL